MTCLGQFLRRRRLERELASEMEAHLAEKVDDLVESGLSRAEAVRIARREFGNVTGYRERSREAWSWLWLETLGQDLRYALRAMRRSPAVTAVALVSLALGLGANIAIFSLIHSVMLESLPVREPGRLYVVSYTKRSGRAGGTAGFSYPGYEAFRDGTRSFAGTFAYSHLDPLKASLSGAETDSISAALVSGSFHEVLGVRAAMGRILTPADDRTPGGHPVAVVSHAYWERKLASDPAVVGRVVRVNNVPLTIVGVAQRGFFGLSTEAATEIWIPMAMMAELGSPLMRNADTWWLNIIGRLGAGVSPAQAEADLSAVYRNTIRKNADASQRIELSPAGRGLDGLRERLSTPLLVLLAAVAMVLLIACANLANLLTARALARQREMALRAAIGATRARLVRQLLTESVVLTLAAGAASLLFARWSRQFLLQFVTAGPFPPVLAPALDAGVFAFAAALSLLTGLTFGLVPALRGAQLDPAAGLRTEESFPAGRRGIFGNVLIASQVALTLVLLIAAGLFAGTLRNLRGMGLGFAPSSVLLWTVEAGSSGYEPGRFLRSTTGS